MNWRDLLNNDRLRPSTRTKGADARNDFESDFGRIVFSSAMRRMHDKTQVFPLTTDDNIHSRLTHSMEVMAIGHSLGIRVCENLEFIKRAGLDKSDLFREIPVILKNACLVHDIGNPPFGHFGETVIQNYFKEFFISNSSFLSSDLEKEDFTFFDGNAQGFRVLTKLQILDDQYGLNLTFGTLGAYLKYPNSGEINSELIHLKKRGIFQSEHGYLEKIISGCKLNLDKAPVRHPLCYLMEAADSICYLVMDLEDGFNKGWHSFQDIGEYLSKIVGIKEVVDNLEKTNTGYGKEITKMVKFRIYLIQRLVDLAVSNFTNKIDDIEKGGYNHELIFDDPDNLSESLKTFCLTYIFPNREITSLELTGHSVITGLLDYYLEFLLHKDKHYRKRAQGLISDSVLRIAFLENGLPENSKIENLSNYYKLRVVVDFISGMTDQFALNHYQKISGQKII